MENCKNNKGVHGAVFLADVVGFNASNRTDVDRAAIRKNLFDAINNSIIKSFPNEISNCDILDIGDAFAVLFPSNVEKKTIFTDFYRIFCDNVQMANHSVSNNQLVKLRCVLHFGEYIKGELKNILGATGSEINIAFRILDSDTFRSLIKDSQPPEMVSLLISNQFFASIVCQQLPHMKQLFTRIAIEAKDGNYSAWLYNSNLRPPQSSENINTIVSRFTPDPAMRGKSVPTQMLRGKFTLADLPGRYIYLSTADYHNYRLYKSTRGSVPLQNHLETAILLSSGAVMHCVDPYRSPILTELLKEFSSFIDSGEIIFLLGHDIDSPRRDFPIYIKRKRSQYLETQLGTTDVDSLSLQNHETLMDSTISLLSKSPIQLHRGFPGTEKFIRSVSDDFLPGEIVGSSSPFLSHKLQYSNFSLRQLLSFQKIIPERSSKAVLGNTNCLETITSHLYEKIRHDSFSRQILLRLIFELLRDPNFFPASKNAIETRISLLHLRINVGKNGFLEMNRERDVESPYFFEHLLTHLAALANVAPRPQIGFDLVKRLKDEPSWFLFANWHMKLLSDIVARKSLELTFHETNVFAESANESRFGNISSILKEHWS